MSQRHKHVRKNQIPWLMQCSNSFHPWGRLLSTMPILSLKLLNCRDWATHSRRHLLILKQLWGPFGGLVSVQFILQTWPDDYLDASNLLKICSCFKEKPPIPASSDISHDHRICLRILHHQYGVRWPWKSRNWPKHALRLIATSVNDSHWWSYY